MGVEFGRRREVGADRELVEVGANEFEVLQFGNRIAGEALLPHRNGCVEAIGEAVFDDVDGLLQGDGLRSEQEVDVVGHDDIRVELVVAQGAVMEQCVDEEFGESRDLEDGAAIVSCGGHERHAGAGYVGSFRHGAMVGWPREDRKSHEWGALAFGARWISRSDCPTPTGLYASMSVDALI